MLLIKYINLLIPPIFFVLYNYAKIPFKEKESDHQGCYGLTGPFLSWDEAMQESTGYDSDIILEKTKKALLKVKSGEAIYERDSFLFDEIQYSWPLLAGLMWVAAQSGGRLNVLDFGGSLGSTYYQNRGFFHNLPEIQWNIIEQSKHVQVGKEYFEDEVLKFFQNLERCLSESKPNVIIISGVLQYLEYPFKMLDKLLDLHCDCAIIDRTPFWDGPIDLVCVQHVPPSIYSASYPSWIFSRDLFLQKINKKGFNVLYDFQNDDILPGPVKFEYRGMILTREKLPNGDYEGCR